MHIREDQEEEEASSSFLSNFLLLEHKVYEAYESERETILQAKFSCVPKENALSQHQHDGRRLDLEDQFYE